MVSQIIFQLVCECHAHWEILMTVPLLYTIHCFDLSLPMISFTFCNTLTIELSLNTCQNVSWNEYYVAHTLQEQTLAMKISDYCLCKGPMDIQFDSHQNVFTRFTSRCEKRSHTLFTATDCLFGI